METRDLATWLVEEHHRAQELTALLHDQVQGVPRSGQDQWLIGLRGRFDHLRAHLQRHMALEERDGYLAAMVEERPTLAGEAERLRHEHRELTKVMTGIHQALQEAAANEGLVLRDCCARIASLLSYIEQHEARENALVLSAVTHDLGTND